LSRSTLLTLALSGIALAAGKREVSLTLGIGTPSADWSDSVLADMRSYAAEDREDETFVWRKYSAAGFEDHPVDCRHCATLVDRFAVCAIMAHSVAPPRSSRDGSCTGMKGQTNSGRVTCSGDLRQ
jgi:hypothetical protein